MFQLQLNILLTDDVDYDDDDFVNFQKLYTLKKNNSTKHFKFYHEINVKIIDFVFILKRNENGLCHFFSQIHFKTLSISVVLFVGITK
jgi:hypothetical protein